LHSLAPDRLPESILPEFRQPLLPNQLRELENLIASLSGSECQTIILVLWQFLRQYGTDAAMNPSNSLRDYLSQWEFDYSRPDVVLGELEWFDTRFPSVLSLGVSVETYRALRRRFTRDGVVPAS
jgi:hypothetical protein